MAVRKSTHVYATLNSPSTSTDWLPRSLHYLDGTSVGRDYLYVKVTGNLISGKLLLESRMHHYDGISENPIFVTGFTGDEITSPGDYVFFINGQTDYRITTNSMFSGNVTVIISTGSNETVA